MLHCVNQVYIIFGMMACGKVFPAAFALLPGKSTEVYHRMWTALRQVQYTITYNIFKYNNHIIILKFIDIYVQMVILDCKTFNN